MKNTGADTVGAQRMPPSLFVKDSYGFIEPPDNEHQKFCGNQEQDKIVEPWAEMQMAFNPVDKLQAEFAGAELYDCKTEKKPAKVYYWQYFLS